jgi:choline dehydrogenase-like flavoprotein
VEERDNLYFDSRKLKSNKIVETDICVVGAGAAGITLALEFINKSFRVCLLESGGFEYNSETEDLNKGIWVGRNYDLVNTRARLFGGTTNTWGGHCVPIRPYNFEPRDWIPYSGWPISGNHLDPYYKRAHKVHKIGEYSYDAMAIAKSLGMELFPFDSKKVESTVSRYNAMDFGIEYKNTIGRASNIDTYLFANVTSINRHPEGDYIRDVSVKTLAGNNFSVRAKYYVLAAGGIENARLLLLSNQIQKNGLGNEYDLVGRFFMEHLFYPNGVILPAKQDSNLEIYTSERVYDKTCAIRCHLSLPEHTNRQYKIPDYRTEIGTHKTSPDSVVSAQILRDNFEHLKFPDDLSQHVLNIVSDPGAIIDHLTNKKKLLRSYLLLNYVELIPNPNSRILLSDQKDKLGMNKVMLDWRLSKLDIDGIRTAQKLIAAEVGRTNFGRLRMELPEDEEAMRNGGEAGAHHMGTTRMHNDPKKGVVDANCRIHGLKNIFIAGSSVFPDCGYSNPTLTIVALAIRLADHLKGTMAKGEAAG